MAIVIVKNTTGSSIFIDDLGIEVDGLSQLNLSELFAFQDISSSADLKILVSNGSFVVNDGSIDLTTINGLKHIYHQTVYEDSFEDGGTSLLAEQLHGVQVRRTTDLSLTTSWQDVYFDTTDIENNTDVIEHSNIDNDRILIKDSGYYLIHYNYTARTSGATRDSLSRVRVNDNVILSGSECLQNLYRDETHQQISTFIALLESGDWITLQVAAGSTPVQTYGDYVFHVTKLEGIRGPKGDDGEPGSILGTLELAAIQIRRTTGIDPIPLSWLDVTFNTTDFEPYPSKIEHDNVNTDRIKIKEDGNYLIIYSYEVDDEAYTRLRVNDSYTIVGSERHQGLVEQEDTISVVVSHSCITNLSADDFITLQIYSSTTYEKMFPGAMIVVVKLEGLKGDVGPQGPQGIQGPPGDASSINETGNLDEAKIIDIQNTSGATPTNLFFYLVQTDNRSNKTIPSGINGDMSNHVILYDGSSWSDIGPFIGIQGPVGPQGPQGNPGIDGIDGNSVKVQKDNSDIMTNVATLNFSGNVEVTTSPGSKVNISFGNRFICQLYDSLGGADLNNSTPVAFPFNQQIIKDSIYTHSTTVNNSRIYVTKSGYYELKYSLNYSAGGKRTVHSYIRKNGSSIISITDSYSYVNSSTDNKGSNNAATIISLTNGDYIEVMTEKSGSSGNALAIANQSWIILEFIREV